MAQNSVPIVSIRFIIASRIPAMLRDQGLFDPSVPVASAAALCTLLSPLQTIELHGSDSFLMKYLPTVERTAPPTDLCGMV